MISNHETEYPLRLKQRRIIVVVHVPSFYFSFEEFDVLVTERKIIYSRDREEFHWNFCRKLWKIVDSRIMMDLRRADVAIFNFGTLDWNKNKNTQQRLFPYFIYINNIEFFTQQLHPLFFDWSRWTLVIFRSPSSQQ